MDEYFEYFLEQMGPPIDRREVPRATIDRYRGHLPDQLLTYWEEQGWCGYADGLFWTVDPQEYEPVLEAWIGNTPLMEEDAYYVIARSAFGLIYLFGGTYGKRLYVIAPDSKMVPARKNPPDVNQSIRSLFSAQSPEACDFLDVNGKPLFTRAQEKLGRLGYSEMYGFVPALALGGPGTLDHLEKIKAVEHLVLLAQFAPLETLDHKLP